MRLETWIISSRDFLACSERSVTSITCWIPSSIAVITEPVSDWICTTICSISLRDLAALSANWRTSSATTAKPRPASPARAAWIEALRANKLVREAIWETTATIFEISWEASAKRLTFRAVSDTVSRICRIPATVLSTESPPFRAVIEEVRATSSASLAFSATRWIESVIICTELRVTANSSAIRRASLDWLRAKDSLLVLDWFTCFAAFFTCRTISRRFWIVKLKASATAPKRSALTSASTVRSPLAAPSTSSRSWITCRCRSSCPLSVSAARRWASVVVVTTTWAIWLKRLANWPNSSSE